MASVYFSESSLFNGLRAKEIGKFAAGLSSLPKVVRDTEPRHASPFSEPDFRWPVSLLLQKYILLCSGFVNTLSSRREDPPTRPFAPGTSPQRARLNKRRSGIALRPRLDVGFQEVVHSV